MTSIKKSNNLTDFKYRKGKSGITLIALVITIIVLLILAGVSIATLTGENGILTRANDAKIEQSHGAVRDGIALAYNEWQIELNTANTTKLASIDKVTIKGEEKQSKISTSATFLEFLKSKDYIQKDTENVLNIEKLTGTNQSLGNGKNTDIYIIEEKLGGYVVKYIDQDNNSQEIWTVSQQALEPDDGKEALILVYEVPEDNEEVVLPYNLKFTHDYETYYQAEYNFTVDWGDGESYDLTNSNIQDMGTHVYKKAGTYKIEITGKYDILSSRSGDNPIEIEQWGTTGLKIIDFEGTLGLEKITSPTQNSFKDLEHIRFSNTNITDIPENLFANCPSLTNFDYIFENTGITNIPENLFANCSNATSFDSTFENTGITNIPENLFENCSNATSFGRTFYNTGITNIPENLFANCPNVTSFIETFSSTGITNIPENLFKNCKNVLNYVGTFSYTDITSIPENLFSNVDWNKLESLEACFYYCSELKGFAQEWWLKGTNTEANEYQGKPDGYGCFAECTQLDNYADIPEYWKTFKPLA